MYTAKNRTKSKKTRYTNVIKTMTSNKSLVTIGYIMLAVIIIFIGLIIAGIIIN